MKQSINQADLDKASVFFKEILSNRAPEVLEYLEKCTLQDDLDWLTTFSTLPRQVKNKGGMPSRSEIEEAAKLRKHLDISFWTLPQISRTYLLLLFAQKEPERFKSLLDKIMTAAEVDELVAVYQAFSLFPNPEDLMLHATNGIRSNMVSVFNAISLHNPFPEEYFNDTAWNQLILKSLFIDSPVHKITGLKRRVNSALAEALFNTVEERYAAGRPIKPEIWYLIGLGADDDLLKSLDSFMKKEDTQLKQGALLALEQSPMLQAKELQDNYRSHYEEAGMQAKLLWMNNFDKTVMNPHQQEGIDHE